jgi:uncharacterized metal-binding protein YceD (DUF177 family)
MNNEFTIPFVGLKIGKHYFDFEINASFFESMEYSIIQKGSLKATLEFEKKETMLIALFAVKGSVSTTCDRCDTPMDLDIQGENRLIYKFGTEEEEDENLVVLHPDTYQIDVSFPIYELITSLLPLRATHKPGECDEEMWELIQKHTINANVEEEDLDDDDWDDDEDWEEDSDEDWEDEDDSDDQDEPEDDPSDRPINPQFAILKNLN